MRKMLCGFIMNKKTWQNIAVMLFLIIVTFIFLLESPLHIWKGYNSGTDSSVFRTIALMIDKGYMPYRDSFDHKGPLLYLINYFGMRISYCSGVWIFEFVFMLISLTGIYKICRLKCDKISSCISTLVSVSLLYTFFEGGNLTEEYAMPFITIALYIFLDYFINEKINGLRLMICGFCFGGVFLLRANMIAVWVVFCLAVAIQCFRRKQFKEILKFILLFLLGVVIMAAPMMVWLGANNAIADFWHDYIYFNSVYTSAGSGLTSLASKWNCFFYFLNNPLVIISVITSIYLAYRKEHFLYGVYTCYLLCTLVFICISGMTLPHYGIILAPAIGFCIASIYSLCKEELPKASILRLLISIYFLSNIVLPNFLPAIGSVVKVYCAKDSEKQAGAVQDICDIVSECTCQEDKISVYGNWDIIYVLSKREHATRYSYVYPIAQFMPNIMEEYITSLEKELPSIVVIQKDRKDNTISDFLDRNSYQMIWSETEDQTGALVYQYAGNK